MDTIITLPKQLANQIAAGEVVERPVSVVKELIENSLDAGATNIQISIRNGGMDEISVQDNGKGISQENFTHIGEKHATSKIRTIEDLYRVMTFGFRGEALASISSISDFTLISQTANQKQAGLLHIRSSGERQHSFGALEKGTKISVKNIFQNVPARLNYLKSPKTEFSHIKDYIMHISLAYPDVRFSLIHDDKEIFSLIPGDVQQRIYEVFGTDFHSQMLPIHFGLGTIGISGYISDPKLHFASKERQVIFVNKRLIKSPSIQRAISDAYNRYIPHGTYSGYVLDIHIDPTQVDVNVHPKKLEVRFANEQEIFRAVYHSVEKTLENVSLVSQSSDVGYESFGKALGFSQKEEKFYTGSGTKFKSYSPYTQMSSNPSQARMTFSLDVNVGNQEDKQESSNGDLHDTPLGKIVGQIFNSYIVVESGSKIVFFDQHALAERVIFERISRSDTPSSSQRLLMPHILDISAKERGFLEENMSIFQEMGFEIELFSGSSIQILAVPDFIKKEEIEHIFIGILHDILEQKNTFSKTLKEVRNKIWAYTACRSAIKFGHKLNIFEMNALLRQSIENYSATCPHGRPVVFEVDKDELKGRFDR